MADVRSLPLPGPEVDQVLLVSTLEHVGADNSGYGLAAEPRPRLAETALGELGRVLAAGRLLVTVPLGEPGDYGWFRLDDVDGWNRLFAAAGLFVEEQEAYELDERRLERGAGVRRRRRWLRRSGPGGVGGALQRALGRTVAAPGDAGRPRTDAAPARHARCRHRS